jgi:hypothetical protein
MNNSGSLPSRPEISLRPLAPVISMKVVSRDENRKKRKVTAPKAPESQPGFYTKPIYRSKKYDLL